MCLPGQVPPTLPDNGKLYAGSLSKQTAAVTGEGAAAGAATSVPGTVPSILFYFFFFWSTHEQITLPTHKEQKKILKKNHTL